MPDRTSSKSNERGLALRFISGKYQGGEFPLADGKEIVVGRSSELDMVLVEEMVSRRHAIIHVKEGGIRIEDLGSTNGTFVNGEKITQAELHEGDRVLIGTSILKVVPVNSPASSKSLEAVAKRRVTMRRPGPSPVATDGGVPRMSGSLEEIPLPDLLQLFGTSRKSGVLVIRTESRVGRIYLDAGLIHMSLIEGQEEVAPLKAMYRMLGWFSGFFELEPPDSRQFDAPLNAQVQEVLMEGFRHLDELNALHGKLPPRDARLILRTPLEAPLHELPPDLLDLLQQALNSTNVAALMDRARTTDLDTANNLVALIDRGYLTFATR